MESGELIADLKGTTLKVYRFLIEQNEPVGVREIQRALNFSSPSLAIYHLSKLEHAGLISHENGAYRVDKVIFESNVRISGLLIPNHLFYCAFTILLLAVELTVFRPTIPTREYFFSTIGTLIVALIFCYETAKTRFRDNL